MPPKNTLFYAANLEPEIARMFRAHDEGKYDEAEKFKERSLDMVSKILSLNEINGAGREEWLVIRNMIEGYDKLDKASREIILSYGKPFSEKLMYQLG